MKKHWVQGVVKTMHKGAEKAAAARAGESTHTFAEAHKSAGGVEGRRARFALALMGMHHKGRVPKESHNRALTALHHGAGSE
jgi:hypothetical protein